MRDAKVPHSPVSTATATLRAAIFDTRPLARYTSGVDAMLGTALAAVMPAAALDAALGRPFALAAPLR
jgi:hypothetical protein